MKIYFSKSDAVIGLHERGFTEDFQLLGHNLLWIQAQIFISKKDFSIVERHSFIDSFGKETIIFGVTAKGFFASGILMNHYQAYTNKTPAIIQEKLKEMGSGFLNTGGNYMDVSFTQ